MRARTAIRRAAAIAVAVVPAAGLGCAGAASARVTGGTITVGVGIDGASLGMTRAQVVKALGRPVKAINDELIYGSVTGVPEVNISLRHGRRPVVDDIFVAADKSTAFTLDGVKVFAPGALKQLVAQAGASLDYVPPEQAGDASSYEFHTTLGGRKVITRLLATAPAASGGVVEQIDITDAT